MRLTRIDFEGRPGHYATAQRRVASDSAANVVVVKVFTPDLPDGHEYHVSADCEEDLSSMAECLRRHLHGYRGTNSDVYSCYADLLRLSDL